MDALNIDILVILVALESFIHSYSHFQGDYFDCLCYPSFSQSFGWRFCLRRVYFLSIINHSFLTVTFLLYWSLD